MKFHFLLVLSWALVNFVFLKSAKGQTTLPYSYNLGIDNGLPDNHIYRMLTDRHGYLWMCTPKGVAKYNGYELKIFTMSDGLANDDVYDLMEDKQGKIWLGCMSHEMGYLYNDKYKKAFFKNATAELYPMFLRQKNDHLFFYEEYYGSERLTNIYVGANDTFSRIIFRHAILGDGDSVKQREVGMVTTQSGDIFLIRANKLFKIETPVDLFTTSKTAIEKPIANVNDFVPLYFWSGQCFNIGDYQVGSYGKLKATCFVALNLKTGETSDFDIAAFGVYEQILYKYPDVLNKFLYVITEHHILQFSNDLHFIRTYSIERLIPDKETNGSKIRSVVNDQLWQTCLGSVTSGCWINYGIENPFKKVKCGLHEFICIGSKDSLSFWWSTTKKTMAQVVPERPIKYLKLEHVNRLNKIVYYRNDTFLIAGDWLYFYKCNSLNYVEMRQYPSPVYDLLHSNSDTFLIASRRGLFKGDMKSGGSPNPYSPEKYYHLVDDNFRNGQLAFSRDIILKIAHGQNRILTREYLQKAGINGIENIVIDGKYGNVLVKDVNEVHIYDIETNCSRQLFTNINLSNAVLSLQGDIVIAAGRFGVAFSKMTGRNQMSDPIVLPNIKDINYKFVYDCYAYGSKVLLNTDKGVYEVKIPMSGDFKRSPVIHPSYKLVVSYMDSVGLVRAGDTVLVNQKDRELKFDVINPLGNGKVKYRYRLSRSGEWRELNSGGIVLPSTLEPGSYYILSLVAYDNVWRSDKIDVNVYIRPYWRQTVVGRRLMWSATILLVLFLFAGAIFITRRLVLAANKKRNAQMELELKSIYAQINPHFIFNTLNSALLLVSKNKMEEAFIHISRFSRLLRSYIKSSRNKLITLADEISNLENYVELLQTRFKHRFEYRIIVDENVDPNKIKIPSLLLQPFVENAINHGILPKKDVGHLVIEFRIKDKSELECIVKDDGVGRKAARLADNSIFNKDASYGDLLIKDLVEIFNKYEHMNIEILYTDKEYPDTGTVVTIKIKNPRIDE